MKNLNENEFRNINVYSWYCKGALACLRSLIQYKIIRDTATPLEVWKKYSEAKEQDFIDATMIKQCLTDRSFLDSFLLQDEMTCHWEKETRNGKEYKTLKVIPNSKL